MKKIKQDKTVIFLCVIIVLLFLGSAVAIWIGRNNSSEGKYAEIYQNGELIQTIDLNTVTEEYTFTVNGEDGEENLIRVREGEIGIVSASCPDHICVNMGFISDGAMPITCLPNHIVIKVTDGDKGETIDGVAY